MRRRQAFLRGWYDARMSVCFIADLHLSPARRDIERRLVDFLRGVQDCKTESLFILGDLFDFWIGDDAADFLGHGPVLDALRKTSDSGVRLFVMRGNRDFLLGDGFCRRSGAQLLDDPALVAVDGRRTVLCHGDSLCADDAAHQEFRRRTGDAEWRKKFLARSLEERLALAQKARRQSAAGHHGKPAAALDVNAAAVEETFRRTEAEWMIHGHTHRPATHRHTVDGRECTRFVLGDWFGGESVLRLGARSHLFA
ncbi:MAG: UDP-2,3-diacylglucosamine diphosphatase [Gammaproteobacteria bacterium]|nr:UDP-2,3-diacylglucosamine diphosphatase [Gammaproteobacteria bacterium]MDD9816250.1 UDP-2,3-diacylglucosamine diphosphatase [Gammaproteobacteria bacterium]MDD9851378.1 UDP-2,3-diacylglucosamine diphosphatase [Gammaproteobacteria bacterium]